MTSTRIEIDMLLLGSGNRDKLRELSRLLEGLEIPVVGIDHLGDAPDVEETGKTFAENAALKAREYARAASLLPSEIRPTYVVSDDSGLCVDALDGAPGVYSARYAGENCNYEDNNHKLLAALEGLPGAERGAHFVCALACTRVPESSGEEPRLLFEVEGRCDGRICETIHGEGGFGYDPVFRESTSETTFAEMDAEDKNRVSHRGDALRQFRVLLQGVLESDR